MHHSFQMWKKNQGKLFQKSKILAMDLLTPTYLLSGETRISSRNDVLKCLPVLESNFDSAQDGPSNPRGNHNSSSMNILENDLIHSIN